MMTVWVMCVRCLEGGHEVGAIPTPVAGLVLAQAPSPSSCTRSGYTWVIHAQSGISVCGAFESAERAAQVVLDHLTGLDWTIPASQVRQSFDHEQAAGHAARAADLHGTVLRQG